MRLLAGEPGSLHEAGAGAGFEADFAERGLVLADVLLEDVQQCLGLLGAHVDALEVLDLHVFGRGLVERTEHEEKVPEVDADLDAVGVALTVVGSFFEHDAGLGLSHRPLW